MVCLLRHMRAVIVTVHILTPLLLCPCVCLLLCLMATGSHLRFPHCLLTQSKPGNHVLINLNVNTHWLHRRCRCTGNFARLPALTPCPLPSTPTHPPRRVARLAAGARLPLGLSMPRSSPSSLSALARRTATPSAAAVAAGTPWQAAAASSRWASVLFSDPIDAVAVELLKERGHSVTQRSGVALCVCVGVVYGCAFVHNRACAWMHLP